MLVKASQDGNVEVVLRLLYTNPFIQQQELRDALWEAVRCRRLEVLRSLLEFKVDPESAPSNELSQAPSPLCEQLASSQRLWTPLLALAVNGSSQRAQFVAELLRHEPRQAAATRGRSSTSATSPTGRGGSAADVAAAAAGASSSTAAPLAPASGQPLPTRFAADGGCSPVDTRGSSSSSGGCGSLASGYKAVRPMAAPTCVSTAVQCDVALAAQGHAAADGPGSGRQVRGSGSNGSSLPMRLLRELAETCGSSATSPPDSRASLGSTASCTTTPSSLACLSDEDLASFESQAENLLRLVREQRQWRLEARLRSVQRKHAQESRGRQCLEDAQACIICQEVAKTILFMPCRHLVACDQCAPQLSQCPICRGHIDEKVRCLNP
eukprot:TRINITY_DN28977_c0_g1_i1.p1 TRINITY_DN28977_c0_g1~~TRINITY_DN28977_c0_g1_i1.p1  ORF type:complete len:382 (+),score=92.73 TRINITY_DN28977_c0_g1_i1:87-1232(+)